MFYWLRAYLSTTTHQAFQKAMLRVSIRLHVPMRFPTKYSTLLNRSKGREASQKCVPNSRKLTPTEEWALENWIISADERGFPPRISMVKDMAHCYRPNIRKLLDRRRSQRQ